MGSDDKFWISFLAIWAVLIAVSMSVGLYAAQQRRSTYLKAGLVLCRLPGAQSESWMPADKCFDYSRGSK